MMMMMMTHDPRQINYVFYVAYLASILTALVAHATMSPMHMSCTKWPLVQPMVQRLWHAECYRYRNKTSNTVSLNSHSCWNSL